MVSCNLQADCLLCANHGNDVSNNWLEVAVDFDARYAIPGDVCKFVDADVSPFVFE
jgi:hypothetical protein